MTDTMDNVSLLIGSNTENIVCLNFGKHSKILESMEVYRSLCDKHNIKLNVLEVNKDEAKELINNAMKLELKYSYLKDGGNIVT